MMNMMPIMQRKEDEEKVISKLWMNCGIHLVQIIETDASIRCGLRPSTAYELMVELSQIVLQQDNKVLCVLPFRHVRRYSYTNNSFSVEVGSRCDTGEGLFIFRTRHSTLLYNRVIANVAKIKQLRVRQLQRSATADDEIASEWLTGRARQQRIDPAIRHSSPIPHYVHNDCEYAQVVRPSSRSSDEHYQRLLH